MYEPGFCDNACERFSAHASPVFVFRGHYGVDQLSKGRVAECGPVAYFVGVEVLVVVLHDGCDGVVVGYEGLHDHAARSDVASGPARDLREKLKGAFGGAEVGHVEADVGRHHTDEQHARKVVALGHHLGADEDIELAFAEVTQHVGHEPATTRTVAVEPRDARVGESTLHFFFEPFGANAEQRRLGRSAPRALFRRWDLMVTVVADQVLLGGVVADLCAKRWVWEQYDHMVMADTVQRPGGDAAVVRVHGTDKGIAMTTDCTPRYCAADPRTGGAQAVAEAWRNLNATGATPLAVTDCLNFGSPENSHVMGQFVGCVEGLGEACRALDFPVVSGNVSFYNETNGKPIQPTPAIGAVGLIADLDRIATLAFEAAGESLILIGETVGHLGASLYAREIVGTEAGAPPAVDLQAERQNGNFIRDLIEAGRVRVCHDVSDGGLAVAVAEMALAGGMGASLMAPPAGQSPEGWLFGEDQGRYVIAAPAAEADAILMDAAVAGIAAIIIGETGSDALTLKPDTPIWLAALRDAHEGWLPRYMAAE